MSVRKELNKISKELNGNEVPDNVEDLFEVLVKYLDNKPKTSASTADKKDKKSSNQKTAKKTDSKINLNIYQNGVLITGYTYDIKDDIKKLKGFWNPDNKGWIIRTNDITHINDQLSKKCTNINIVDVDEELEFESSAPRKESSLDTGFAFSD